MTKRKLTPAALESLLEAFNEVPDPRINRRRFHPLVNVLTMALFGAISGCEGWDDLAFYAEHHAEFFRGFLDMPRGTPSADTFRRVFEALDPMAFQKAFRRWLRPLLNNLQGQTIAMDGKTLRGAMAHARTQDGGAFHLMHVWATEQRLLLAQKSVKGAPGEVQAAIELLEMLDIKGATVTADANSCTAAVTAAIRGRGANYVLALKGNRGALHKHVKTLFVDAQKLDLKSFESHDAGHGRLEYRRVRALPLGELPPRMKADWTDLKTVVLVERVRTVVGASTPSAERAYYITSHAAKPQMLAKKIRAHWSIENQLHHCLDVTFAEDRRRIHSDNGAQNFALVTRYALSMLKRESSRMSVAMKRKKSSWSPAFILNVLTTGFAEI